MRHKTFIWNIQRTLTTEYQDSNVKVKGSQSWPTLHDPTGILQARILEWVAYPFSRGFSWPGNRTGLLHCRWILYQLSYQGSPLMCRRFKQTLHQRGYTMLKPDQHH